MYGLLNVFSLFCAVILGNDDSSSARKTEKQTYESIDYRTDRADGSKRFVADELSDYYRIHHIVKLLENVTRQKRKRENDYMTKNIALRHIDVFSFAPFLKRKLAFCHYNLRNCRSFSSATHNDYRNIKKRKCQRKKRQETRTSFYRLMR